MPTAEERILELEDEIRRTPYNKATQHHIGRLKARIARLKEASRAKARIKPGSGYALRKAGDATLVIVGYPSVGKSTLLNNLTGSASRVAAYDFTTLRVVPGVMEYQGARFQVLDVPGLIQGASHGRGHGREVLSVIRGADLIVLLIDVFNLHQLEVIDRELYGAGIRLDQSPPNVGIVKRARGGLNISSTMELTKISEKTMKEVLSEYKIHNADVVLREDISLDRFIDAVAGNRVYIPSLVVLNKVDLIRSDYLAEVNKKINCIAISAKEGTNLAELKAAIYDKLEFIRIYTKQPGEKPDYGEPMILVKGSTVGDACDRLHRDFRRKFKHAKVWGNSAKHRGQRVGIEHVLRDGDVLAVSLGR